MSDTPNPSRIAPPSLRPARLDPLQVDVLAALIATIPAPTPAPRAVANDQGAA